MCKLVSIYFFLKVLRFIYIIFFCLFSSRSICSCSKAVWHIPLLSVQWINSWWWTDELSETCRVSWQNKFVKLVRLVGFSTKKFITMHGHMNVKFVVYPASLLLTYFTTSENAILWRLWTVSEDNFYMCFKRAVNQLRYSVAPRVLLVCTECKQNRSLLYYFVWIQFSISPPGCASTA
jgi:hypothetical protein